MSYLHDFIENRAPQSEPIPGTVANNAGGYVYKVSPWTALDRFLILGTEGGSYYATERDLTKESISAVKACIEEDGERVVKRVVTISYEGRAPKNDPALFVLAMCASARDVKTRRAAFAALPIVARIGTHLLHFAAYMNGMRGWGRAAKRAVANWYLERKPEDVAFQALKYQQRDGWSHRDLLRLTHPKTEDIALKATFDWIAHGDEKINAFTPQIVEACRNAKSADDDSCAALVRGYNLQREMIPTERLGSQEVWRALFDGMGMTAMIRNLGKLSSLGIMPELEDRIVKRLEDAETLKRARVHPFSLLLAAKTYGQGRGDKGSMTWPVSSGVYRALDDAFYRAFPNHRGADKRIMIGLDVSGSMSSGRVCGASLTPREAAAAMCLLTAATEPKHEIVCFANGGSNSFSRSARADHEGFLRPGLWAAPFRVGMSIKDVCDVTARMPYAGTDCSLPIIYAAETGRMVDGFVIYTDSETWAGYVHPSEALKAYRRKTGIDAKLVVVGMVSNNFSIADPNDAGMLDCVGFDTSTPQLISDFIRGFDA